MTKSIRVLRRPLVRGSCGFAGCMNGLLSMDNRSSIRLCYLTCQVDLGAYYSDFRAATVPGGGHSFPSYFAPCILLIVSSSSNYSLKALGTILLSSLRC